MFPWSREIKYHLPWMRTILLSGILNDKDAIEIAAKQKGKPQENHVQLHCILRKYPNDEVGSVR